MPSEEINRLMGAMRVSGPVCAAFCAAALCLDTSLAAGAVTDDATNARALDQILDSSVAWKLTPSIAMAGRQRRQNRLRGRSRQRRSRA
jgi:hypothetical protein